MIKHDLERILDRNNPLHMVTDSKSLFDTITKCTSPSEKRLLIDISTIREAYEDYMISDVGFTRYQNNPAHGFTKIGLCKPLNYIVSTNRSNLDVECWVIRKKKKKEEDRV